MNKVSSFRIWSVMLVFFVGFFMLGATPRSFAQEEHPDGADSSQEKVISSSELVRLAWAASSRQDLDALNRLVKDMLQYYGEEAGFQQSSLTAFPEVGQEQDYQTLNDVATILFIQAEALMNAGKSQEAIEKFTTILEKYKWAKSWDPRGWYWSVAEKSQASIDVLTDNVKPDVEVKPEDVVWTFPKLVIKGTAAIVDYSKYGDFVDVGKETYRYIIRDPKGLAKAVGEGIYPNLQDFYKNPRYQELKEQGEFEQDDHWTYVNTTDLEKAYFKWFKAKEPWGVRLFYLGLIFEKSGMYHEALKAYYALIVHFPKTVAWTSWQTPWYPAQAAIAKIRFILRMHLELGLEDRWMKVQVKNGFDNDEDNDSFVVYPGKIVKRGLMGRVKDKLWRDESCELKTIKRRRGSGKVRLVQYENDHWQLLVDGKPYVIKGITYEPTKIGQSPDKGTLKNWMEEDTNQNGLPDGPFDAWVDKNRNNQQDDDEPVVGDFQLLKEMGVNTIRIYHVPTTPNKELLRKMYNEYGIRVAMGDFIGKYAIGSGADWSEGTDYENPEHQAKMMEAVLQMVREHKDEPYMLLWILGNENNYGVACNADKKPEAYFKFADQVAKKIKEIDPDHPVAIVNGDVLFLDIFGAHTSYIDIFAANVYRGDYGFGSFWEQVIEASGRPAFITEYGAPAFAPFLTRDQAEEEQAVYHKGNWLDIESNLAGNAKGVGSALGGFVFEWMDEWWKNYEPYMHDRKSDAIGPFPGGYYFEEWFGVVSQGEGKHSPFLRQLRKSYFVYKELWNKK